MAVARYVPRDVETFDAAEARLRELVLLVEPLAEDLPGVCGGRERQCRDRNGEAEKSETTSLSSPLSSGTSAAIVPRS